MNRPPVIDSHLHVWDLTRGGYNWLTPAAGPLYESFLPERAQAGLLAAGIDSAVLVQADDTLAETQYLLDVASRSEWVAGVVGWVQLDSPSTARAQLDHWRESPAFVGVRHLTHDDPRERFLEYPPVRQSLRWLAAIGLPLDVPDAWPRQLGQVAALAEAVPELVIVIDHLGKPPRGGDDFNSWRAELARTAANRNTVAKLSGLGMPGRPHTVAGLRRVVEVGLELFGPDRLLFGSNWPVSIADGDYSEVVGVLRELIASLSGAEQAAILGDNARRIYRWK
jgi:L-fuconolactonase